MGIFKNIFGGNTSEEKKVEKNIDWIGLNSIDQLDEINNESSKIPVAIFKHSTRCGISRGVLKAFERTYDLDANQMKLYYLDLLNHRDISNKIAEDYSIMHQSPQLLIVKNGVVVAHDSHSGVNDLILENYI